MTTATTSLHDIEVKIDAVSTRLDAVAALVEEQTRRRARWDELGRDLTPVAGAAFERLTVELDDLGDRIDGEQLASLARRLARSTSDLEALLDQLERLSSLGGDLAELAPTVFLATAERLDELERRGYFEFARGGLGVLDRVVTSFGEEDIRQLGDNIVLILDTVKEMTQPEVMRMLQRTARVVREEPDDETPTLRDLIRDLRDPAVKRGLHRVLTAMRSLSDADGDPQPTDHPTHERRP